MFRKIALASTLVLPLVAAVQADAIGYTAADRAAIRSMPITQRPNRPGHFYGRTVRTLHKLGVVK
jgi:hypothetical protein